ncbi:MAG: hypothetical protein ACTSVV_04950 [Promethearchaeota archaeon]
MININFNERIGENVIIIPREVIEVLEEYINEHEEMKFENVSEFIIFLIREKIRNLIKKS